MCTHHFSQAEVFCEIGKIGKFGNTRKMLSLLTLLFITLKEDEIYPERVFKGVVSRKAIYFCRLFG